MRVELFSVTGNERRLIAGGRLSSAGTLDEPKLKETFPAGSYEAALRELYEETSIRSVQKLGEIAQWLTYDLPSEVAKKAWKGKYRGQKQKWYALRFTGKESEINIDDPGGGHRPEFVEWRWVEMRELPGLVIPFKRQTYERVVKEFERFARDA